MATVFVRNQKPQGRGNGRRQNFIAPAECKLVGEFVMPEGIVNAVVTDFGSKGCYLKTQSMIGDLPVVTQFGNSGARLDKAALMTALQPLGLKVATVTPAQTGRSGDVYSIVTMTKPGHEAVEDLTAAGDGWL